MSAAHTPGAKVDLIQCLKCQQFWRGICETEECPHCHPESVGLLAALRILPTYRPVRLAFGVTMHRDVTPNEAGWIKREDLLAALTKAQGAAS